MNPLQCTVLDVDGTILYRDIEGSPFILDSNHRVNHYMQMSEDDCFYGFGEKGGDLNKHIPFYIRMNRETQKAPEEELFVRWVQNGIFQPRFSIHSASSDNTVTEPWMYQESAHLIREAILFRYNAPLSIFSGV